VTGAGVCISPELVGVATLIGHAQLNRIAGKFVALKAKIGVLLGVQGRAEKHEGVRADRLVIGIMAMGAFSYIILCRARRA
jgi:hypothetical protein